MDERIKRLLRCPSCGGAVVFRQAVPESHGSAGFSCSGCAAEFPILEGVPRFLSSRVEQDHAATSFVKEFQPCE